MALKFVQLNRWFAPIRSDKEFDATLGHIWGPKIGGWVQWEQLLKQQRVVLLAEADSGKTEEFRATANTLFAEGKAAFFLTVESLSDGSVEDSLEIDAIAKLHEWQKGYDAGYFFLDSVDEARLNRKRLHTALRCLSKAVEGNLSRCHLYVSCRYSDWRGNSDRLTIERIFPFANANDAEPSVDYESALLDPIFKEKTSPQRAGERKEEATAREVLVVGFVPLQRDQQRRLAEHARVNDVDAFSQAIVKHGLDNLVERPGDLINLAGYWIGNRKFGSFTEMLHLAVEKKLVERDVHRADNDTLSANEMWQGIEQLAAAFTFAKSFSGIAPGLEQDFDDGNHCVDPTKALPDWSVSKLNGLLRRGVFSPSTYGRVRFHHRSTQEYLTARWLERLLTSGCPAHKIHELIFAKTHGVTTVRPSLRAVTAWLCGKNTDIRAAVLQTDPLILIQHGDPQALPLQAKIELLKSYAARFAAGNVYDDAIDNRSLWLFSDKALAATIKEVWVDCAEHEFRGDLLRLIFHAQISECSDILEKVAFDEKANVYHRVIAVEALVACDLGELIARIKKHLVLVADTAELRFVHRVARELFPKHLSPTELVEVIRKSRKPDARSVESFGYGLAELLLQCPTAQKDWLLNALADMALSKPHRESWRRVSRSFSFLTKEFASIAHNELQHIGEGKPSAALVKVLMVIERADNASSAHELEPCIEDLVNSRVLVKEQLFWADIDEALENEVSEKPIENEWQIYFPNRIWRLDVSDLSWLETSLASKAPEQQRRIALSACVRVLERAGRFPSEAQRLSDIVSDSHALCEVIKDFCQPSEVGIEELKYQKQREKRQEQQEARTKRDKDSWRSYRDELLNSDLNFSDAKKRDRFINHLSEWLHLKTKQDHPQAMRQWPLLQSAFSPKIALAYRDELLKFWRGSQPERPIRTEENRVTTKWATIWAYGAVGVEADIDSEWVNRLHEAEAERAAQHAIQSEQGCPDWLDGLAIAHPAIVHPMLKEELHREWTSAGLHATFLNRLQDNSRPIDQTIVSLFLDTMLSAKVGSDDKLGTGLRILVRADLSAMKKSEIWNYAESGFCGSKEASQLSARLIYLAYMFLIDPDRAFGTLREWMTEVTESDSKVIAVTVFADLFDRHHLGLVTANLSSARADTLKALCELAYEKINPRDDEIHPSGGYTPNKRDHAESGRGAILSALINKGGREVYDGLLELAEKPSFADHSHRFKQLARSVAERDSELPRWTEAEFCQFSRKYILPILNADELHHAICETIDSITYDLFNGDASALALLKKLNTENAEEGALRDWLMEQLKLRSQGRYHAYKENHVADSNRTDITIAATSGAFEMVVEVKQADSWTLNELGHALENQLGEDYLRVASRRHGVLFMSNHGRKGWNDPITSRPMNFATLVECLSQKALCKTSNSSGTILLAIKSLDVSG